MILKKMEPEEHSKDEEVNLEERVKFIQRRVSSSYAYWALKRLVKQEIVKQKYKDYDVRASFSKIMKDQEIETKLKNKISEVYNALSTLTPSNQFAIAVKNGLDASKPIPVLPSCFSDVYFEPLESVRTARLEWSQFLRTRLVSLCFDFDCPLLRVRRTPWVWAVPPEEAIKGETDDDGDKIVEPAVSNIPCVYDKDMLLEAIKQIDNRNYTGQLIEWGEMELHLRTASLDVIRAEYEEIDVCYKQFGLDEDRAFVEERTALGEKLLNKDYIPYLVQYCKRGVPNGLRAQIYMKVLGLNLTAKDMRYFQHLLKQVQKWEYGLDKVMLEDIRDCCNDDKFFIFHENLEQMVMCFLRDPWVSENLKTLPNLPMAGVTADGRYIGNVPLCGVIPFKHFSSYGAAFTYVSERVEECYFIFRNFYCRYLSYLHSITSNERGIISLLRLFEDVLQAFDPDLVYHLSQLKISPLKLAFPWIVYCFVGYLEPDQVFVLLDRIIGYDSAEIVALTAVALIIYRSELLMQATTQDEVDDLFYDISHIKVIPLLQHFLFMEKNII